MKIEHFKKNEKGGTLQASFHVIFPTEKWGDWHVNMSLFKKAAGDTWLSYPSREYLNAEGEKKYFKMSYPDELGRDRFETEVRNALNAQIPAMQDILSPSKDDLKEELPF